MKLPKSFTTVTPFSKLLAMILFILFPIIGFYFGMKFQEIKDKFNSTLPPEPKIYTSPIPTPTGFTVTIMSDKPSLNLLNWTKYENKNLGIRMSYPNNYTIPKEETIDSGYRVIFPRNLSYVFEIKKIITDISVDQWWADQTKDPQNGPLRYIKSQTTFKGLPVYYFKINEVAQVPMDFYAIKKGEYILTISFETEGNPKLQIPADESVKKDYEKYLQDFRIYDKVIIDKMLNSIEINN